MARKGFVVAEEGHVVQLLTPQDLSAATSSEVFSMANWQHASIICLRGAGSASTIQVEECDDFTPTNAATMTFKYAYERTAAGDTLTALATATTAGIAHTTSTGELLVIEIDADELSDGYECVRIKCSAVGTSLSGWVAILSGGRFQEDITATAIA